MDALVLLTAGEIMEMPRDDFFKKFVSDIARSEAFGQIFTLGVDNVSDEDKGQVLGDLRRNGYAVENDEVLDEVIIAVCRRAVSLR